MSRLGARGSWGPVHPARAPRVKAAGDGPKTRDFEGKVDWAGWSADT